MIGLRDGVHITTSTGYNIVADARSHPGDHNIVSHAHTDHILTTSAQPPIQCSGLTAALANHRTGTQITPTTSPELSIQLLPAGHIVGSRAALITDEDTRILYTGDVCTRDRAYLEGFSPVPADVLILETTYGLPSYRFPAYSELESAIHDWITDNNDHPIFLFGYPLGRSQKLHHLAHTAPGTHKLFVHETIDALNTIIEQHTDLSFPASQFNPTYDYGPGDIILLPSTGTNNDRITTLINNVNGLTAGFSGWAVNAAYNHRGRYDATFPLSDHCDFTDLVSLVNEVDPTTIYTHHGFAEAFAGILRTEYGYDARPLLRNQAALTDYS